MSRVRQLPGGGKGVEVVGRRLAGWFDRFAEQHGGAVSTDIEPDRVELHTVDGSRAAVAVPFGVLPEPYGNQPGLAVGTLVEHVRKPRRVGLVLVRLGGHSVGVTYDGIVEQSSTGRNLVHGRNKAGGWSQKRFARRREGQTKRALDAAADTAARVLLPVRDQLDAVVLGGDKQALDALCSDPRLAELLTNAESRVLDVPEPRRAVLDAAADRVSAVEVEIRDEGHRRTR